MLYWARPQPPLYAAGCLLVALGAAVRVWAAGTIHKSKGVTQSGPYAWVRHPLYVGSFLIACGFFALSGLWQAWVIGVPLFLLFHWAATFCEEKLLVSLFGGEYVEYARRVPRAVPRPPRGAARGSFSWNQVLYNREPLHLLGTLFLVAVFGVIMAQQR